MTLLKREQLAAIIDRDVPGYRLAAEHPPQDRIKSKPDAVAPGIEQLRRKYLGGEADAMPAAAAADTEPHPDDVIVVVEPKEPEAPLDVRSRPKTVVVSGRSGKVVGSQG